MKPQSAWNSAWHKMAVIQAFSGASTGAEASPAPEASTGAEDSD